MLQRIYGTAWENDKALKEHLHRLEEAERRDHRKLGVELDLFSFPDEIGSGLAVFHPKGGTSAGSWRTTPAKRHIEAGYDFVNSPHITKSHLFEESGHLDWYADGMYPPMELDGGTDYYLKPMNCPFHILIYKSRTRSYRELPLRYFEFGTVYRYEKSGVVHGLTRVRGMTQDDAHIFTTKELMVGELESLLDFVLDVLRDFGLDDFYLELSTKPEGKAVGTDEEWDEATEALREAASKIDLELVMDEGGGAFYGPKISVQARDAIGRTWQLSTIQLDFQLPQRFDLHYIGADNERHRPIMIHRALFGSIERFFAILLEHYAGAFPLWLAPVQVSVLPVADRHHAYAFRLVDRLQAGGLPGRDPRRAQRHARQPGAAGEDRQGPVRARRRRRRRGRRDRRRERARRRAPRARREGRRFRRAPPRRSRRARVIERRVNAARAAVGRMALGVHLRRGTTEPVAGPVLLLRAARAGRRRGDDPRAHRHDVHADERVPVHVGAPAGRAAAPRVDARRARPGRGRRAHGRDPAGEPGAGRRRTDPGGINVGANIGRAAGAGVPGHVHVHALPRWDGDTNFMTAVAEARVLPESLRTSYDKLRAAWPELGSQP